MFYAIYVLAILCKTVLSFKIHTPGHGMVLANMAVSVSWSRHEQNDPVAVAMVMENLIGGEKTALPGTVDTTSADSSVPMTFSSVGTFRLWAVNPANVNEVYAMSKSFDVLSNAVAASNVPNDEDDGDTSSSSLPSPPGPDAGAETASSSVSPGSTSTSLGATSGTSSAQMMPIIIGGVAGGIALLAIIAGAVIFMLCRRRRARVERRTTFHRTRMVRSLPPPTFALPRDAELASPASDNDARSYRSNLPPSLSGPYPFSRPA